MKQLSFLLFLLLTALPTLLPAQEQMLVIPNHEPFVRQHEFRLTAGAYPLIPYMDRWTSCGDQDFSFDRLHRGAVLASGSWSLAYDYRFTKWFDLGAVVNYYGEYSKLYGSHDWTLVGHDRTHYISVMPVVRFTWLNRKWVRMYSSTGLGLTMEYGEYGPDSSYRDLLVAFQFTPIGISVGRSLFGFAEVGVGVQGALMIGIGYKFNPKNKSTK